MTERQEKLELAKLSNDELVAYWNTLQYPCIRDEESQQKTERHARLVSERLADTSSITPEGSSMKRYSLLEMIVGMFLGAVIVFAACVIVLVYTT